MRSFESPPYHPLNGTPGRIRTYDKLIKSQLLYQLSYGGMFETKQRWKGGSFNRVWARCK